MTTYPEDKFKKCGLPPLIFIFDSMLLSLPPFTALVLHWVSHRKSTVLPWKPCFFCPIEWYKSCRKHMLEKGSFPGPTTARPALGIVTRDTSRIPIVCQVPHVVECSVIVSLHQTFPHHRRENLEKIMHLPWILNFQTHGFGTDWYALPHLDSEKNFLLRGHT